MDRKNRSFLPNRPWVEIASLYRKKFDEGAFLDPNALQEFAMRWVLSVGMPKRYAVALAFIESLPERSRPKPNVVDSSFTAIELIELINRRDPRKARELVSKLGQPGTRVSAIRRELKNVLGATPLERRRPPGPTASSLANAVPIPASRSYAASARRVREETTYEKIERLLPKLSGPIVLFHRPIGVATAPMRTDAIAWLDDHYGEADGFEFLYASASMTETLFSDMLNRVVVAATFFRRYFLVFTPDSDHILEQRAVQLLGLLRANTVGVVAFGAKDPQLLKPKDEAPVPDRRELLKTLCPKGRWASVNPI